MRRRLLAATLVPFALAVTGPSCSPDLGALPARCSEGGECPEGYECINDVCAEAGTPIPITVTALQYLRPIDLHLVPQESGALVAWQVYQYDLEAHDFAAARLRADGSASEEMILVGGYPANANYLEPYFDVLAISDTEALLAFGAAPFDDQPESRLTQYAVTLPPPGDEARGAAAEERWELRMRTLGYGAVSRPELVRTSDGVSLAYFESQAGQGTTRGDLAVFELETDGSRRQPSACADTSCCQADECQVARDGNAIAVGVADAFVDTDHAWWIVDDTRPSFLRQALGATGGGTSSSSSSSSSTSASTGGGAGGGEGGAGGTGGAGDGGAGGGAPGLGGGSTSPEAFDEGSLPRLALPVSASGDTLLFLQPSERGGQGLPFDPVKGPASLWSVALGADGLPGAPTKLGDLPGMRDTPRPMWVNREGKPALVLTPGTEAESPTIRVFAVDPDTAKATEVASIDRFSTVPVSAIRAVVVGGKLYVAWLDESPDVATVRAAVLPEP